jgi:hypothetical protein
MKRTVEWAAGLFEGEGSICVRMRKRGRQEIQVSLVSTDKDVVRAFYRAIELGGWHGPYKYAWNRKAYWTWTCHTWAEALVIFRLFWPYMGARRRGQIRSARNVWRERKKDTRWLRP